MSKEIIPIERIARTIFLFREQKVMLDYDLAVLYGIETRALKQAVRRNRDRFPSDFMFERRMLETNRELARKFEQLERRVSKHDEEIAGIMEAIRQLMAPTESPRREIGFHVREKTPRYRVRKR